MKYLVLIQARCGSSRLPGKIMKDLSGKTDLQWVIERVQRSRLVDEVMVITSIEKQDLQVVRLCAELGVRVFIGSEQDVLDRYYQAARLLHPEYVIRITADCPLFDWRYLDLEESFPDGEDIEIIKFSALKKSWKEAELSSEREHVTLYIRKHPELFHIQRLKCPLPDIGEKRWTLDEEGDYQLIRAVYHHFISRGKDDFVTEDILEFLAENPQLEQLNAEYIRNEGALKSIANDRVVQWDE